MRALLGPKRLRIAVDVADVAVRVVLVLFVCVSVLFCVDGML